MDRKLSHKLGFVGLAVVLALAAVPAWAGQVLVYSQAPNFQGLYASQNDVANMGFGAFATSYDNFTLGSSTTLTQVTWVGGYYNPQSQGSISGWTATFWSNNGGQPGSALATFTLTGNGGETFLQNDNLGDPTYSYSAAVSFAAAGGTEYWLSVVPNLAFPPQWGWTSSSQGDGISYQDYFGVRSQNSTDLAFSLYMTQQIGIPEPGSLVLLGTGIAGLAGVLRRKLGA